MSPKNYKYWFDVKKRYLLYKLGMPKPVSCAYFMTYKCNLSCSYCPIGSDTGSELSEFVKRTKKELNTEEAKYAISQLKKIGILKLTFSGGEPLIRRDLEELAAYAKENGMKTILTTNGTLLDKGRGEKIDGCFDEIEFSIAGMEEMDDRLRGGGTFERLRENIRHVRKTSKGLAFLVNKYNIGEVEKVLEFAKENCDFISFWLVHFADEFCPGEDAADDICEKLVRIKKENKDFVRNSEESLKLVADFFKGKKEIFDCNPFDLYLTLQPDGSVGGCCYPWFAGNILEEGIEEIFSRKDIEKEILRQKCSGCFYWADLCLAFQKSPIRRHFLEIEL